MAKIIIKEKGRERLYEICEDLVVIGSGGHCNIVITDGSASRDHAQIRRTKAGYRLMDLETKSGTQVNDRFVNTKILDEGDTIQVGTALLIFSEPDREPTAPPSASRRILLQERASYPSLGGLITTIVGLLLLIIVVSLQRGNDPVSDMRILEEARQLVDQRLFDEALQKLSTIHRNASSEDAARVSAEEREIRESIREGVAQRVAEDAQGELRAIDDFAQSHPTEGDAVNRQLDAWESRYLGRLADLPQEVEKLRSLRDRFPKKGGGSP